MGTKTNDYCSGCGQKDTCRLAYEKMGRAEGPNVAWKAIVAFAVPILVFILSLAGADLLFRDWIEGRLLTIADFLAAVLVTFAVVLAIRALRHSGKNEHCEKR